MHGRVMFREATGERGGRPRIEATGEAFGRSDAAGEPRLDCPRYDPLPLSQGCSIRGSTTRGSALLYI
jgi:hypothetical protein